jgi:hypothetical protein
MPISYWLCQSSRHGQGTATECTPELQFGLMAFFIMTFQFGVHSPISRM